MSQFIQNQISRLGKIEGVVKVSAPYDKGSEKLDQRKMRVKVSYRPKKDQIKIRFYLDRTRGTHVASLLLQLRRNERNAEEIVKRVSSIYNIANLPRARKEDDMALEEIIKKIRGLTGIESVSIIDLGGSIANVKAFQCSITPLYPQSNHLEVVVTDALDDTKTAKLRVNLISSSPDVSAISEKIRSAVVSAQTAAEPQQLQTPTEQKEANDMAQKLVEVNGWTKARFKVYCFIRDFAMNDAKSPQEQDGGIKLSQGPYALLMNPPLKLSTGNAYQFVNWLLKVKVLIRKKDEFVFYKAYEPTNPDGLPTRGSRGRLRKTVVTATSRQRVGRPRKTINPVLEKKTEATPKMKDVKEPVISHDDRDDINRRIAALEEVITTIRNDLLNINNKIQTAIEQTLTSSPTPIDRHFQDSEVIMIRTPEDFRAVADVAYRRIAAELDKIAPSLKRAKNWANILQQLAPLLPKDIQQKLQAIRPFFEALPPE